MPKQFSPIAIIGAGSWGTALALYLSRQGQIVRLWSPLASEIQAMLQDGENKTYLPGQRFSANLQPILNIAEAVQNVQDILIAAPSTYFRETLVTLRPLLHATSRLVWATKGLDQTNGKLLHDIVQDVMGPTMPTAVLSGPSFAYEVAKGLPTAVVIASENTAFANDLENRFNSPLFRIHLSQDITGVEICGIVKNVVAIATGIFEGLGLGANARSVLITHGLAEMTRLGLSLGAAEDTFTGLAGLGDLILTCTDNQSRNRRFGLALGQGKTATEATQNIGQVVEGACNTEFLIQLAEKNHVEMPIIEAVWSVLQNKKSAQAAMQELMASKLF